MFKRDNCQRTEEMDKNKALADISYVEDRFRAVCAERNFAWREVRRLKRILVRAAIPLEVLNGSDPVPGVSPKVYEGIREALREIRGALHIEEKKE